MFTDQGFPNSAKEWGEKIPRSGGGIGNFTRDVFLYQEVEI